MPCPKSGCPCQFIPDHFVSQHNKKDDKHCHCGHLAYIHTFSRQSGRKRARELSVESESVSSNAPSSTNRKADNSRESGARQTYKTIDQNSSTSLVNNSLSAPQPNISDSSHHINNNRLGVTITEKDSSTNTQTSKSIPTLDPIAASSKNGNTAAAIQPTPSTISATSSDEDIVIRVAYKKTNDFAVGFRVKPFQPLNKIFDVYCQRRGKPRSFFQFFFNDVVVRDDQTPLSIGIEDKNTIFALPKYE